jgi:hypothetical protein
MAFTSNPAPVAKQISDNRVRIIQEGTVVTPFALAAGATGTIGLHKKTVAANITLPEGFKPEVSGRPGGDVTLQDAIDVQINRLGNGAVLMPIQVVKTGTTPEDFQIALTNNGGASTGLLEIYVSFR